MLKTFPLFFLFFVFILLLISAQITAGYFIHLRLGSEDLTAWGEYLTGSATLILAVVAIVASVQGLREYRSRATAEKAKWLVDLYKRLFEDPGFKDVRRKLDYDDTSEIIALIQKDHEHQEFTPAERIEFDAFTDYLNFFELMARLKEIGQLTSEDIRATFDYYLKLLTIQRNPQIRKYLGKEGFENLDKLLLDYETEDSKSGSRPSNL